MRKERDDEYVCPRPRRMAWKLQGSLTYKEGAPLKDIFSGDCSGEDVARATSLLVPQPLALLLSTPGASTTFDLTIIGLWGTTEPEMNDKENEAA